MKKFVTKIIAVMLLLFLFVLLLDIVIGVIFSVKDGQKHPTSVRDYPYLYFLQNSGTENPHGFLTTHSVEKAAEKYRIIMIGGSVVRGSQNNPETTIAANLQQALNERLNTDKIEVVNAGVNAFVVQQEFLLIQLILQEYEPDMIIGLDGFNDLYTLYNLWFYDPKFMLPPQNWKDFRVIRDNRKGRLRALFPSIDRLITTNYLFDLDDTGTKQIQKINDAYWKIIQDTRDFCKAKDILYFSFLQPIKWYSTEFNTTQQLLPHQKKFSEIYSKFEATANNKAYAFSLTSALYENLDEFMDECHLTEEGNRILALEMAEILDSLVQEEMKTNNHDYRR